MAEWSFLTKHALVLINISHHPHSTALELATAAGITERATRKIIADLLDSGHIAKRREGRRNHYRIRPDLPLPDATPRWTAVGDLLEVLGWKRRGRRPKSKQAAAD